MALTRTPPPRKSITARKSLAHGAYQPFSDGLDRGRRTGKLIKRVARDEDGFENFQELVDGNEDLPLVQPKKKQPIVSTPLTSSVSRRRRLSVISSDDGGSPEPPIDTDLPEPELSDDYFSVQKSKVRAPSPKVRQPVRRGIEPDDDSLPAPRENFGGPSQRFQAPPTELTASHGRKPKAKAKLSSIKHNNRPNSITSQFPNDESFAADEALPAESSTSPRQAASTSRPKTKRPAIESTGPATSEEPEDSAPTKPRSKGKSKAAVPVAPAEEDEDQYDEATVRLSVAPSDHRSDTEGEPMSLVELEPPESFEEPEPEVEPHSSRSTSSKQKSKEKGKGKAKALTPVEEEHGEEDAPMEDDIAAAFDDAEQENVYEDDEPPDLRKSKKARRAKSPEKKKKQAAPAQHSKLKRAARNSTEGNVRRSSRVTMKPLAYWRNEKVVYGRSGAEDDYAPLPVIKEVIRVPQDDPIPLGINGKRKRRAASRAASRAPRSAKREEGDLTPPEHGWDEETVAEAKVIDYETKEQIMLPVFATSSMLEPKPTRDGTWLYQKVHSERAFAASGLLEIPVDGNKPWKSAKDNAYFFFVHAGAVMVQINETKALIAQGGTFMVPRGNGYFFANASNRPSILFFAQAREVPVYEDPDADIRSRRSSAGGSATPSKKSLTPTKKKRKKSKDKGK